MRCKQAIIVLTICGWWLGLLTLASSVVAFIFIILKDEKTHAIHAV